MASIKKSILENMLKDEKSEKKLVESFHVFLPTRNSIREKLIILIICIVPSYFTSHSYNTVVLFKDTCDVLLNVFIALFGIIFTGFIFFQALLNDELLILLITTKTKKKGMGKSKLEEVNDNFAFLMMLYLVAIMVSLILTIIIPCISSDFTLFLNIKFNNLLAWFLIQIFYMFSAELIWRMLSFIHNIYQLFKAYAVSRIVKLAEIEDDNDQK